MQVVEASDTQALCRSSAGAEEVVDLLVVGPQQEGTWLLVHLGVARHTMTAADAAATDDALGALAAVLGGRPVDGFFADLAVETAEDRPHPLDRGAQ
jgi:hydrogenase assembly chaperone HypC/HupF